MRIFISVIVIVLFPSVAFASCNPFGVTAVYVNGILTNYSDAKKDLSALQVEYIKKTGDYSLKFTNGYNQSHLAGLGDLVESASQILNNPINSYDLNTILLQIYPEVTTRKILLVGHSQGTFYTNEIYDYLLAHGESKDTVGVYNVATPASLVAGYENVPDQGAYLTSENDKVINAVRTAASKLRANQPLPANITIPLTPQDAADSFGGHSLSGIYLANNSVRVISDVGDALKKLSVTEIPNTADAGCFTPPPRDPAYYTQKLVFAVADPVATGVVAANKNVAALGETALAKIIGFSQSIASTVREAFLSMFGGSSEKVVQTIDVNNIGYASVAASLLSDNTTKAEIPGQFTETPKTVAISKTQAEATTTNTMEPQEAETVADNKQEEVLKLPEENKKIEPPAPVVTSKICSFTTSQTPSHFGVIINEVAWMGGSGDFGLTSTDEWIELKNISGSEVDLRGWQLTDKAEQIKINLAFINESKIKAGQFILLERTDDDSAPNVPADLVYSNTLNNTDEGLRLFDNQCNLIDEVLASPNWPAGDSVSKRTMEREANLNWHTFGGNASGGIWGTPKRENGQALAQLNTSGGDGSTQASNQQQTTSNSQPAKILISEIQISPTGNRFIELYNPNSSPVGLTDWYLQRKTQTGSSFSSLVSKTYFEGKTIGANSYFLISRSALGGADIILDNLTLTGSNVIQLKNSNAEIADKLGWGQTSDCENNCALEPSDGQSIQRRSQNNTFVDTDNNASDFETQSCPSPKAQLKTCQSAQTNQVPSVLLPLSIIEVVYNPEGPDEGKELVKVNNPNVEEVNVGGYSLQYLGSDGDFTKIKKKNFAVDNKIPGQGIFKIGANCHSNTPCENVNMSWSEALSNTSGTVFLVSDQELLTGLSDSDIVDGFHYPETVQLTEPANFDIGYDPSKLEINLSWVSNPSLTYQIQEYNSPGVTIFEGKGSSFSKHIDEVGKSYKFSIKAFNENAEYTELIEKEITVPSFIKDVRFYNSTHYTNQGETRDNLIEVSYNNYPFLPLDLVYAPWGISASGPNYKTIVFYLNTETPKRTYLNSLAPLVEDINNVLRVKYEVCASSESNYVSLVLPDTAENCNTGGEFGNGSMRHSRYLSEGDKNLLLPALSVSGQSTFTESDYVTLAFYGFERDFPQGTAPVDGIYPNFKLLAVDNTKYYFQSNTPMHSAPQLTGEITLNFDKQNSRLNVSWPSATDPDTLDALLTYEIKYNSSADWQLVNSTNVTKIVSASDNFSVSVRAKDDFGNYSAPALIADWSYPASDFTFVQNGDNTWSSSFGLGYGYYGSEGNGINLQSLMPINTSQFNTASLRIKQLPPTNDYANLKLSVYPDNNNQPDFNSVIASSVISNLYNPDSNSDLTFHFTSPVTLSANSKYWLALEVESYADSRGFLRNAWQNAVSSANPYSQGEAARIKAKVTDGVYSYSDFTIEPDNDWYVKLGLEQ